MSRDLDQAQPQDYADIFEANKQGALILDALVRRFGGAIYVKGGLEGDRQTAFNAGRRDVLDHILNQINLSNGVQENESENVEP